MIHLSTLKNKEVLVGVLTVVMGGVSVLTVKKKVIATKKQLNTFAATKIYISILRSRNFLQYLY